jgi:hypothetical protein
MEVMKIMLPFVGGCGEVVVEVLEWLPSMPSVGG